MVVGRRNIVQVLQGQCRPRGAVSRRGGRSEESPRCKCFSVELSCRPQKYPILFQLLGSNRSKRQTTADDLGLSGGSYEATTCKLEFDEFRQEFSGLW